MHGNRYLVKNSFSHAPLPALSMKKHLLLLPQGTFLYLQQIS